MAATVLRLEKDSATGNTEGKLTAVIQSLSVRYTPRLFFLLKYFFQWLSTLHLSHLLQGRQTLVSFFFFRQISVSITVLVRSEEGIMSFSRRTPSPATCPSAEEASAVTLLLPPLRSSTFRSGVPHQNHTQSSLRNDKEYYYSHTLEVEYLQIWSIQTVNTCISKSVP